MRRLAFLLAVVALAASVTGCSSSKSTASSPETTTSETTTVSDTVPVSGGPVDAATFANGLSWFYADASASDQKALPDALAACTQAALTGSDPATVAAIKVKTDRDGLTDGVRIRVIRATSTCNRDWLTTLLVTQVGLDSVGVSAADQKACVASAMLDNSNALDDTKATGTSGESLRAPLIAALESCATIEQALTTLLSDPSKGNSPELVACVAPEAAKAITWTMLINQDTTVQSALVAANTTCGGASGG